MSNSNIMHALIAASLFALASTAATGDGNSLTAEFKGPADLKGVTVSELGTVTEESLKTQLGIEGFVLRMREVTIQPDGHIGIHDHGSRPGVVRVVKGSWVEVTPEGKWTYEANKRVGMLETHDTKHWLINKGTEPATAIVCGIQPSNPEGFSDLSRNWLDPR